MRGVILLMKALEEQVVMGDQGIVPTGGLQVRCFAVDQVLTMGELIALLMTDIMDLMNDVGVLIMVGIEALNTVVDFAGIYCSLIVCTACLLSYHSL